MTNIFIFPASNAPAWRNFERSIRNGVDLDEVLPFLKDEATKVALRKRYPEGKCYLWGAQEKGGNNRKYWNKMEPGDVVLGVRSKVVVAASHVIMKDDNPQLAKAVWPGAAGEEPFRLLYFLEKPLLPDTPTRPLQNYFGDNFQNFKRVGDEYLRIIVDDYGSVDAFVNAITGRRPKVSPAEPAQPTGNLSKVHQEFYAKLSNCGFRFEEEVVRSFVASLATKRFVILSGLSGSGKTQLAVQFGRWLGTDSQGESLYRVVPVRPDWTGAESLFGFEDALREPVEEGRRPWFVPPALEFMLRAYRDPDRPYLLILDEMNLAHVERYFADALSGMESEEPCIPNLQEIKGSWVCADNQRQQVSFPHNLFVVGTVNVDETTYMFSPKVLDRANTFEFRVQTNELEDSGRRPEDCAAGSQGDVAGFLALSRDDGWQTTHSHPDAGKLVAALKRMHGLLTREGYEFGHRVFYEALRFSAFYHAAGNNDWLQTLDRQVMQKVLPRLHGSRRRLEQVLNLLAEFCISPDAAEGVKEPSRDFPDVPPDRQAKLQVSFDKLYRMHRDLLANQFTSFTG